MNIIDILKKILLYTNTSGKKPSGPKKKQTFSRLWMT